MEVMWLKLKGYCRFKEKVTLNLSGKLIALLGSNEAGKTSILNALVSLNADGAISKDDMYKTTTDDPEETYIKARFLLSPEEIKNANLVPNSKLEICKKSDVKGIREFEIYPSPEKRDLLPRQKMAELMKTTLNDQTFMEAINNAEANGQLKLQNYFNFISSKEENLLPQPFKQNSQLCLNLLKLEGLEPFDDKIKVVIEEVQTLLDIEKTPNPTEFAINVLKPMLPIFLLFSDEDRQLKYQYPVAELSNPSKSLTTLAGLAELDLKILSKAITDSDSARVRGLLKTANKKLSATFDDKWSQSHLEVELDVNNKSLEILLSEGDDKYTELKLRSDGFRQFLALVSFASSLKEENVILLIDEVELHLHYDGQADLLQALAKQSFAKKIVYSTHSIGCLPEDLGGIKIVERTKDEFTSTIENKFWKVGNGFAPLLPKIGAQQLAFLPLRNAVIVEGPMDMLLLPLMFQQAIERDYVGFLIAHGISEQSLSQTSHFEGDGLKVIYLTDCDGDGKKFKKQLIANRVDDNRIFNLPGDINVDIVRLEELITTDILVKAFNAHLTSYRPDEDKIEVADISVEDKVSSLETLAVAKGLSKSDIKVPLAYEILSIVVEDPTIKIVDEKYLDGLKKLHKNISDIMNIRG